MADDDFMILQGTRVGNGRRNGEPKYTCDTRMTVFEKASST